MTTLKISFILTIFKLILAKTEIKNCEDHVLLTYGSEEILVEAESGCDWRRRKRESRHCVIEINTLMPMNFLQLSFSEFNVNGTMPDCGPNYLEVLIGCDAVSIGVFCGQGKFQIPHEIFSYDECMTLVFHTDGGSPNTQGFTAGYNAIGRVSGRALPFQQLKVGSIPLNTSSGVLSSISWPLKYPSTETFQQKWVISIKEGYAIKLSFMDLCLPTYTSNVNKSCTINMRDVLSIKGDLNDTELYCGKKKPFYIIYRRIRRLEITFMADGDGQVDRGFILGYIQYPDSYKISALSVFMRWILIAVFLAGGIVLSTTVSLVSFAVKKYQKRNHKQAQSFRIIWRRRATDSSCDHEIVVSAC